MLNVSLISFKKSTQEVLTGPVSMKGRKVWSGLNILSWLARSPDLNPTENVEGILNEE